MALPPLTWAVDPVDVTHPKIDLLLTLTLGTSPLALFSCFPYPLMDLVCETTPLLAAERVLDEEATALPTSPPYKRGFPNAQQVAALMLITTVWPFSFEMIYPFINQVRLPLGSLAQHVPNICPEVVYYGNRSYR